MTDNFAPVYYDVTTSNLQYDDGAGPIVIPYTGPAGPTGSTGAAGPAGAVGPMGATGASGPNLVDATTTSSLTGILMANGSACGTAVSGTDLKTINGNSILGGGNIAISGGGGATAWYGNVMDYGAVGNGTTDDTAAFVAALAANAFVVVPYTATGYCLNTGSIAIASGKYLLGINRVTLKSTAAALFNITGYNTKCGIRGFNIDMTGSPSVSTAITLKTALTDVWKVEIDDIIFNHCVTAIQDETSTASSVIELKVQDVRCLFTRGRQIYLRRTAGFIQFNRVAVDLTQNTSAVTWEGARFENVGGLELTQFDVLGGDLYPYSATATGLVITNGSAVWLRRVLVDSYVGPGIVITSIDDMYMDDVTCYVALGNQIQLTSITNSELNKVIAIGAKGVTGAASGANGISITSCSQLNMTNVRADSNTGSGIIFNNSTDCRLSNVQTLNSTVYGVGQLGTCNRIVISDLRSSGNGTDSLVQLAGCDCLNWYPNSGTYTAATLGAATVA